MMEWSTLLSIYLALTALLAALLIILVLYYYALADP